MKHKYQKKKKNHINSRNQKERIRCTNWWKKRKKKKRSEHTPNYFFNLEAVNLEYISFWTLYSMMELYTKVLVSVKKSKQFREREERLNVSGFSVFFERVGWWRGSLAITVSKSDPDVQFLWMYWSTIQKFRWSVGLGMSCNYSKRTWDVSEAWDELELCSSIFYIMCL